MKTNRCTSKMETQICLRLVLVAPPVGVDFGIQHGKGRDYTTIQKQRSKGADLRFDCVVTVKGDREEVVPNFVGPLTQGPASSRFIYIDVGKLAGQPDSCWERRIKVPLGGITWEMIEKVSTDAKLVLEAHFPGTAKDGGPSCATVKPVEGWKCSRR